MEAANDIRTPIGRHFRTATDEHQRQDCGPEPCCRRKAARRAQWKDDTDVERAGCSYGPPYQQSHPGGRPLVLREPACADQFVLQATACVRDRCNCLERTTLHAAPAQPPDGGSTGEQEKGHDRGQYRSRHPRALEEEVQSCACEQGTGSPSPIAQAVIRTQAPRAATQPFEQQVALGRRGWNGSRFHWGRGAGVIAAVDWRARTPAGPRRSILPGAGTAPCRRRIR